jgi:hypothetical protein
MVEPNHGVPAGHSNVPPPQVGTNSVRVPTPTSQLVISGTPTPTNALLTRTTTTTSEVLHSTTCNDGVQDKEDVDYFLGEIENEDSLIPSWFNLDMSEIYNHLNPSTKKGQQDQRAWRKSAIDNNRKEITSIGIIANRLLKILTGKKFLLDTPLHSKLQSKKVERQQQLQDFIAMGSNPPALIVVQKFLSENICMPLNADGIVIDADSIPINIGA